MTFDPWADLDRIAAVIIAADEGRPLPREQRERAVHSAMVLVFHLLKDLHRIADALESIAMDANAVAETRG